MTDKLFMKFKLTTLLAFVACAFISCADTFELARNPRNVLYVRTDGNDATAWYGYTNRAWSSITGALSFAHSGDKVIIGAGNFTNASGFNVTVPSSVTIYGLGTNSTFIYGGKLALGTSNEVEYLTWNMLGLSSSAISAGAYGYIHDSVFNASSNAVVLGGSFSGWNVYSNVTFVTTANGVLGNGTNYFFNCSIVKSNNTSASGTILFDASGAAELYWSGGSITSLTNSTDSATNNFGVFNASSLSNLRDIFIQNATISTPTGAYDIYGNAAHTNYISGITWSITKTNSLAQILPFAGFANTNSASRPWQATWAARVNTNNYFLLTAPPTNSP